MAYLGNLKVVMYVSDSNFIKSNFGVDAIEHSNNLIHRQIDQTIPSWIDMHLVNNILEDETGWLQFG